MLSGAEPSATPKWTRDRIALVVLLAACHAIVVWAARAAGSVPVWLFVVAAMILGTAAPALLNRLDDSGDDIAVTPLTTAEKFSLMRIVAGFFISLALCASGASYALFYSTDTQAARAPRIGSGAITVEATGSVEAPAAPDGLRGAIGFVK